MKYVVANSKGEILIPDASRASEAINWARNKVSGECSVRKIPEVIRVVGGDEEFFVADEETAKIDNWWKTPVGGDHHQTS